VYAVGKEQIMNFNLLSLLDFTSFLGSGTPKYNVFSVMMFAERQYGTNLICGDIGDYNKKITLSEAIYNEKSLAIIYGIPSHMLFQT